MVVFPGPAIDADGLAEDGIVTTAVSFDSWVLETDPALEEMTSNETVPPETNFR
jgi:hypothetical protein